MFNYSLQNGKFHCARVWPLIYSENTMCLKILLLYLWAYSIRAGLYTVVMVMMAKSVKLIYIVFLKNKSIYISIYLTLFKALCICIVLI